MARNPDHVTIAVADARGRDRVLRAARFPQATRRARSMAALPARYMGMPDMKAEHITLALEGAEPRFEIQLLEFDPTSPDDPGQHPTNLRRRGYNHLAFRVDDIEAATRATLATA